jgi:hypothetical protein
MLTMFYKLIFKAIGYKGPYIDYGAESWPRRTFLPTPEEKQVEAN